MPRSIHTSQLAILIAFDKAQQVIIKLTLFFILVHAYVLHRLVSPGLSRGVQCPCLRSVGHGLSIYYYGYAQIVNNIILLYLSHSGYGM